jgi:hypothetical protein
VATIPASLNLDAFKQWAKDCAPAAKAVLMAQAFAELERARVDAYTLPIFSSYTFRVNPKWAERYGETVKAPKDLYLCDEEDKVQNYFEDCDKAHRAHGFKGPQGHCPALTAEHLHMIAEGALMQLAQELTGIDPCQLYGENRAKYLQILIGACAPHIKGGL